MNNESSPVPIEAEVEQQKTSRGIFLGMAILAASVAIGKSFIFFGGFLILSLIITLAWRKHPVRWAFLVSAAAATPVLISKYQVTTSLAFALWSVFLTPRYLLKLPKWLYGLTILAFLGVITSSLNWLSGDLLISMARQATHAFNFLFAPLVLLPLVYARMRESRGQELNLKGLLFCLILPSTLLLLSAKLFGTVMNAWQASQHAGGTGDGFFVYRLGKAYIVFLRTDVGFILAALICASTSITVSLVGVRQRIIAGGCLVANVFLMLSTASFGSIFASMCGLAAIFVVQIRRINLAKLFSSIIGVLCLMIVVYALLPAKTKQYLEGRYEHRIENKNKDRLELWTAGAKYFLNHPEGVGHTLGVPEGNDTVFVHNEYIVKFISYGALGGLAYVLLIACLFFSLLATQKNVRGDPAGLAVWLAGLGVLIAASVNSMTDHFSGTRVYYNVIWSLIWYCYFCSLPSQNNAAKAD